MTVECSLASLNVLTEVDSVEFSLGSMNALTEVRGVEYSLGSFNAFAFVPVGGGVRVRAAQIIG